MGSLFDDLEISIMLSTFDLNRKLCTVICVDFWCVNKCVNSGVPWKIPTIMIPTTIDTVTVEHLILNRRMTVIRCPVRTKVQVMAMAMVIGTMKNSMNLM